MTGVPTNREPDWRLKESRTLRSEFKQGTLVETHIDPVVLRLLKYHDGAVDEDIEKAITLYVEYNHVARCILDDISCGTSIRELSHQHKIKEEVITLLQQIYDDGAVVGSATLQAITRSRLMSPSDRKRYLMRRKYGKFAEIFTEGAKALDKGLSSKDIIDMVRHALVQSYMVATSADQVDLDSGEQKTVIAYNGLMVNFIKLLNELESSSSDSSAILERMAQFTAKIPKDIPKVPALEELEDAGVTGDGDEFKLAPLEDLKGSDE